jgi:hypothetical protein
MDDDIARILNRFERDCAMAGFVARVNPITSCADLYRPSTDGSGDGDEHIMPIAERKREDTFGYRDAGASPVVGRVTYGRGDLLQADTEALVNTVNCGGVMGKGIALQFRRRYPAMFATNKEACQRGEVAIWNMLVIETSQLHGPSHIVNFPTNKPWRAPSHLSTRDRSPFN